MIRLENIYFVENKKKRHSILAFEIHTALEGPDGILSMLLFLLKSY